MAPTPKKIITTLYGEGIIGRHFVDDYGVLLEYDCDNDSEIVQPYLHNYEVREEEDWDQDEIPVFREEENWDIDDAAQQEVHHDEEEEDWDKDEIPVTREEENWDDDAAPQEEVHQPKEVIRTSATSQSILKRFEKICVK